MPVVTPMRSYSSSQMQETSSSEESDFELDRSEAISDQFDETSDQPSEDIGKATTSSVKKTRSFKVFGDSAKQSSAGKKTSLFAAVKNAHPSAINKLASEGPRNSERLTAPV